MTALKLAPLLLCWGLMALVLSRFRAGRRTMAGTAAGFVAGVVLEAVLLAFMGSELAFGMLRQVNGLLFLALLAVSVRALYRPPKGFDPQAGEEETKGAGGTVACSAAALVGVLAGAMTLCRIAPVDGGAIGPVPAAAVALAGAVLAIAAAAASRFVPEQVTPDRDSLAALLASGLFFLACSTQRLDIFSPLSMEVMKFVHDFVHQFFESMLIPDHPFFRSDVWEYIGFLFSDDVGFWGGIVIWFAPVLLVALSVRLQRLPAVAHIRQGAERRRVLAGFIRQRRYRLAVPLLALFLLSGAVYRSRFPAVEYWDPKPVAVTATAAGEILIPRKGEIDLDDGRLHKFIYRQGGREARFFLVRTPSGELVANLDACAICKPDGYGQSGDMVICYYCNTLIPLTTVGKPGGCNPVPVSLVLRGDMVGIDGGTLLNTWYETVQQTTRVKQEGR